MTHIYSCLGFLLRSEIALPELASAEPDRKDLPVIDIRYGPVPEALPQAAPPEHGLQVAGNRVMLSVAGAGRFLITDQKQVLVEPAETASERRVRLFLLGSVLGILCHQRGLLPLHANAVVVDGVAVAFAGASGTGKSTLAAHFARDGHDVLCDDVCAIGFDATGKPVAWPGLPRVKLWGDAAASLGHDCATLDAIVEGLDKYHVPLSSARAPRPVPFHRLYVLTRGAEGEDGSVERLQGRAAIEAVMAQTYRGLYIRPLGLAARHFQLCVALSRHAGVYAASRAWGFDVFEREVGRLERHMRQAS